MGTLMRLARFTLDAFRPPRMQSVSEWADENRVLVSESSAEPGRWRTDRAPYQREVMDAFTQPGVWQIVIMASAQVGKTELELNMMGRAIDTDPGPMLFIQPTDQFAEDFSKRRIAPMIRACPALQRKVYEAKSRDAGNTIGMKTFPGGSVAITGANSPTELAGRPVRYVFMDEVDRFPASAGTEGSPEDLAERRTETFRHNRRIVKTSTPTNKGTSRIERAYMTGTQEEWHVRCPHCGAYSFITFDNIAFTHEAYKDESGEEQYQVGSVAWRCPTCQRETGEYDTKRLPAKWVQKNPKALESGIRSFRLNAFMSPWRDWKDIVRMFLKSRRDPEELKVFHNTVLGETWEARDRSGVPEALFSRREEYPAEVPPGALLLTMGVDTQDNRLEYEVVGWSQDEESWGISRGIIPGRPDRPEVWHELDALLDREYARPDGRGMRILATFVDSGGHMTDAVYRECTRRYHRRVFAIKGEDGEGREYVRMMKRKKGDNQAVRFLIGVDAGKEAIFYSTTVQEPGARYMHFPSEMRAGYDMTFFRGLISERMVVHRRGGRSVMHWEKTYERNEPLDCRNYARAAFKYFNWDFAKFRRLYEAPQDQPEEAPAAKPKRRNRRISEGIRV